MAEAFDHAIQDLERVIDRHFAAHRTLVVEREGDKWTAAIGDDVLYRSYDGKATLRFAQTFCERTPGVTLEVADYYYAPGYSVRVDNVVPLHG